MIDQSSGRFEGKNKIWYKCELEQDVSESDPTLSYYEVLCWFLFVTFYKFSHLYYS